MTTRVTVFSLFYFAISICFVFKTNEFSSAGITVDFLFSWYLKNEFDNFIMYHIRRSTMTLLTHSFIPMGYVLGLYLVCDDTSVFNLSSFGWTAYVSFSILLPIISVCVTLYWRLNNWANHPIVKTLKRFCDNNTSWVTLAQDINSEYRSFDKVVLSTSSVTTVIATENWLLKVSPYNLNVTHQSDSVLILCSADTHDLSADGSGPVQYVNIEVKTTRPGVNPFYIRCNALDFRSLQDKVRRPISILEGITFHKTKMDQFLEVFKKAISNNPPYTPPSQEELEMCIGCMVVPSSVKLLKKCGSSCTNCYCRPLWCVDCIGKWFASRQEQNRPET